MLQSPIRGSCEGFSLTLYVTIVLIMCVEDLFCRRLFKSYYFEKTEEWLSCGQSNLEICIKSWVLTRQFNPVDGERMNKHTHIHTHTHTHIYTHAHTHTHVYIYIHTHKFQNVFVKPQSLRPWVLAGTQGRSLYFWFNLQRNPKRTPVLALDLQFLPVHGNFFEICFGPQRAGEGLGGILLQYTASMFMKMCSTWIKDTANISRMSRI